MSKWLCPWWCTEQKRVDMRQQERKKLNDRSEVGVVMSEKKKISDVVIQKHTKWLHVERLTWVPAPVCACILLFFSQATFSVKCKPVLVLEQAYFEE